MGFLHPPVEGTGNSMEPKTRVFVKIMSKNSISGFTDDDRSPTEYTEFLTMGRMQAELLLLCDSLTDKYFELIADDMQHAC
jgi:hypothetical protein